MLVDHKLIMDLATHNPTPIVHIKQGDVWAHAIVLTVYEAGEAWTGAWRIPASGETAEVNAVVRYRKPDGYCGTYDKMPNGSPAVTANGNTLTIALAPQLAAVPGMVDVDIQINAPQTVTATYTRTIAIFNIRLNVEAHPMNTQNVESNNYECTTLQEINGALGKTVRTVNGVTPDSSGNVYVPVGVTNVNGQSGAVNLPVNALVTCTSAGTAAVKTVSAVDGFILRPGAVLAVKFTKTNTAENPRLSYGGNEMPIIDRITGAPVGASDITVGVNRLMLGPTGWILLDTRQTGGTTTPVPGDPGEDGGYWIPAVDEAGNLTWSASKAGMGDAPAAANISGPPGKDGGYYIPKISQSGSNIMQLTFDPSEPGMTSVQARQIVLPKGDPGQDGTSPTVAVATITGGHRLTITDAEGSKSADILDGVTPALQIGAVATLDPGSAATASITGTPAAPILNLGIPRGADAPASEAGVTSVNGQSGSVALALPGLGTCSSEASAQIKSISVRTAGFEARDGALLAVKFNNFPNTANGPVLEIGSRSYPVVSSASYNPPKAAALFKAVHLFILAGQAAILLDPADFAAAVEEGLAV